MRKYILVLHLIFNPSGNTKLHSSNTSSHKDCNFLPESQPLCYTHSECPGGSGTVSWGWSIVPSTCDYHPCIHLLPGGESPSLLLALAYSAVPSNRHLYLYLCICQVHWSDNSLDHSDHITETQSNLVMCFHFLMFFSLTPDHFPKG